MVSSQTDKPNPWVDPLYPPSANNLTPAGVLARAINGAMGWPRHDHGDSNICTCDGTVGDHYALHVLKRIEEDGYALVPARRLQDATERVMRNVVCGEWYDDPANDRGGAAVARLHDAEREMWALYDELGIDPGDSYIRRRAELVAEPAPKVHEPGDFHSYTLRCKTCGQPGLIRVTIDPERAAEPAPEATT